MKGVSGFALVVAVAAVVVSVIALVSDDEGGELKLTYTETGGSLGSIPLGETSRGVEPSRAVEAETIGLGENGEEIGEINNVCLIVTTDGDGQCNGTATLPDGGLVLNLYGPAQGDISGSIVGGTGDYLGAYGTFEWNRLDADPTYTFEFTVP
jgi:hypothetical protein